jgi:hypothetical protein
MAKDEKAILELENSMTRLFSETLGHRVAIADFSDIADASAVSPLVHIAATDAGGMAFIVRETVDVVWLTELTAANLKNALGKTENGKKADIWAHISTGSSIRMIRKPEKHGWKRWKRPRDGCEMLSWNRWSNPCR